MGTGLTPPSRIGRGRYPTTTAAGRALKAGRWGFSAAIIGLVGGNLVRDVAEMSGLGVAAFAVFFAVAGAGAALLNIRLNSTRLRAGQPLALFAARASARIDQLKAVQAWAKDMAGAGRSRATGGMVSGGLAISRFGIAYEPGGLERYRMLTLPWSDVATVEASDSAGMLDEILLEVVCRDGSEVAFLTSGRKRLRSALAAVAPGAT